MTKMKESAWVDIAKAEPNRRGFFVGALEPAFKSAAGGEEIRWSEVEFFPTHDPAWLEALTEMEIPEIEISISAKALSRLFRAGAVQRKEVAEHQALHHWLALRCSKAQADASLPAYINSFLSYREGEKRDLRQLRTHIKEHRIFQVWCIFREAYRRCELQRTFPEWLVRDLLHLSKRGGALRKLAQFVVQRYQALQSHGLVRPPSACGYCQGALEQRGGRGRPRTYHHSCSGLAKREQDRARGKPRPRPRVPDTD